MGVGHHSSHPVSWHEDMKKHGPAFGKAAEDAAWTPRPNAPTTVSEMNTLAILWRKFRIESSIVADGSELAPVGLKRFLPSMHGTFGSIFAKRTPRSPPTGTSLADLAVHCLSPLWTEAYALRFQF